MSWDIALFRALYGGTNAHGAVMWAMLVITFIGGGHTMLAMVPFLAHQKLRPFVIRLLILLSTTAVIVFVLKALVRRTRPCACLNDVCSIWAAAPTDPSFPSGHAAGAFAFVTFVVLWWHLPAKFSLPLYAAATTIAISRVYLGVHFPSDIIGGAALGATLAAIALRITRPARRDEAARAT